MKGSGNRFIILREMLQKSGDFDAALLLESMTQSVLLTTADLDYPGPYILYVNRAFEQMTGWNREEILGKSPRILQGPKTDHTIFNNLKDSLMSGTIWSGRTINYRKDGSEFHMEWSIVPIRDQLGAIVQYFAIQKEVTEIVKTEMKLEQAQLAEKKRVKEIEKTNKKLSELLAKQNQTLSLFTKYVPQAVVERALSSKHEDAMTGEKLDVAILFCDIRDFTSMIEGLSPDQVVKLLNIYYSSMAEVITVHQGVINQFVGDEIFVAFGAPLPIEDPQLSAVRCAMAMIEKLQDINVELRKKLQREMAVGIGVNYGSVIAGNLGSDEKLAYAVTGSEVITAKRIESLTRDLQNKILISASVHAAVKDSIPTKPWGKVALRGHPEDVNVHQVLTTIP